jgi:MscS family membrane protein
MDSLITKLEMLAREAGTSFKAWVAVVDWTQIGFSLAGVFIVIFLRKFLARMVIWVTRHTGNAIGVEIGKTVENAIKPAIRALIVSLAVLLGLEALGLPTKIAATAERLVISVAIAAIFSAAYSLSVPFAELLRPYRTAQTQIQVDWAVRLAKFAVVFVGIAAVLKVWGIDIGPVLTGMGLAGAAVALAAQDLFKNLIGGMSNISEKRFQVGDWIRLDGVIEGVVESVDFRSTLVRRFDKAPVFVPNADLSNAALINYSRMRHRRIYWTIKVVISTTTSQLSQICKAMEHYIDESGDFVPVTDAMRLVRVDSFGDSSINIQVYCFTRASDYPGFMEAKEKLLMNIKDTVEQSGTSFAFPSRSIYLETTPEAEPGQNVPDQTGETAGRTQT